MKLQAFTQPGTCWAAWALQGLGQTIFKTELVTCVYVLMQFSLHFCIVSVPTAWHNVAGLGFQRSVSRPLVHADHVCINAYFATASRGETLDRGQTLAGLSTSAAIKQGLARTSVLQGQSHASSCEESAKVVADSRLFIVQAGFQNILIVHNDPSVVIFVEWGRIDLMLSIRLEFSCFPEELVVAHLAINSNRLCVQLRIR